jgi:hypothetical protein
MLFILVSADPSPIKVAPRTVPAVTIPPEAFIVMPETVPVALKVSPVIENPVASTFPKTFRVSVGLIVMFPLGLVMNPPAVAPKLITPVAPTPTFIVPMVLPTFIVPMVLPTLITADVAPKVSAQLRGL